MSYLIKRYMILGMYKLYLVLYFLRKMILAKF